MTRTKMLWLWLGWLALGVLAMGCTSDAERGSVPYVTTGCSGATPACGAGQVCVSGRCLLVCEAHAGCPDDGRCVEGACYENDGACGTDATCLTTGESCVEGACVSTPEIHACASDLDCPTGSRCNVEGGCVHVATTPTGCETHDQPCYPMAVCDGPQTDPSCHCPEGYTLSPDLVCADIAIDPSHCGACGHACEQGQACYDGVCVGGS